MVLFDEWFEWLVTESWASVMYYCRSICLHDCLVVNGTSKFIIYIPSRHGCFWSLAVDPETRYHFLG